MAIKLFIVIFSKNLYNSSQLADYYLRNVKSKQYYKFKFFINSTVYSMYNNNKYTYLVILETLRESVFNYDLFRKVYLSYYKKEFKGSNDRLT